MLISMKGNQEMLAGLASVDIYPSPSASSSPTCALPVLEYDELDEHPRSPVPTAGNTLVSVPLGFPLVDLLHFDEARTGIRVDSHMEWHIIPPDSLHELHCGKDHLQWNRQHKMCSCKIRHLKDTAEGHAHIKALIAGKTPVKNQASTSGTPATVKSNPGMKHSACPKKRVRVEASLLSPSASGSNEVPRLTASTPPSSLSDPSINFTLVLCSVLVAAVEALDQSLQDQGVSEKLFGSTLAKQSVYVISTAV
ncbi:hypothetical protein EDD15DRAFT_2197913 [Pisolithus albus]|nr:hypothetical protein EDD15DRAFT_2197913 [Pisolithus albus]